MIDQNQYNVQKINDRKSTGNAVWEGALALTEYMEKELPEGFFKGKVNPKLTAPALANGGGGGRGAGQPSTLSDKR